jgi:hypothetical protein
MAKFIFSVIFALALLTSCSSDPAHPMGAQPANYAEVNAELKEGKVEVDRIDSDPCAQDAMMGVPDEYSRCNMTRSSTMAVIDIAPTASISIQGCQNGCTEPEPGCEIKGNINAEGVKIYHVKTGAFYSQTVINPNHGERWFCTEQEAVANGWRKSKQ